MLRDRVAIHFTATLFTMHDEKKLVLLSERRSLRRVVSVAVLFLKIMPCEKIHRVAEGGLAHSEGVAVMEAVGAGRLVETKPPTCGRAHAGSKTTQTEARATAATQLVNVET